MLSEQGRFHTNTVLTAGERTNLDSTSLLGKADSMLTVLLTNGETNLDSTSYVALSGWSESEEEVSCGKAFISK